LGLAIHTFRKPLI